MEINIALCLLIGIPGAGKTTLAKHLVDKTKFRFSAEFIHVSFDDLVPLPEQQNIVTKIKHGSQENLFKALRSKYYDLVCEIITNLKRCNFKHISSILNQPERTFKFSKFILVLDDNFYYRSMRYKFHRLACEFSCGFCQIYIKCDVALACQRNKNRKSSVKDEVIFKMANKIEPPLESNGWEKQFRIVDESYEDFESVRERLLELLVYNIGHRLKPPVDNTEAIKAARDECMKNLQHRSDLILRSLVSLEMKKYLLKTDLKTERKIYSSLLNEARLKILLQMKEGSLDTSLLVNDNHLNIVELEQYLKLRFISEID